MERSDFRCGAKRLFLSRVSICVNSQSSSICVSFLSSNICVNLSRSLSLSGVKRSSLWSEATLPLWSEATHCLSLVRSDSLSLSGATRLSEATLSTERSDSLYGAKRLSLQSEAITSSPPLQISPSAQTVIVIIPN